MNNNIKLLIISLITILLSGILFYQGLSSTEVSSPKTSSVSVNESTTSGVLGIDNTEVATVLDVVDGDTIQVDINGQKKKLRYIGINTPETVDPRKSVECYGKEASNENKRLVEGKKVYLEKDISETDKYGRLLRYVYLPLDDGSVLFVNDYLVRQGFAAASTFPPDIRYSDQFNLAQKQAHDNNRGLWATCKS